MVEQKNKMVRNTREKKNKLNNLNDKIRKGTVQLTP